MFRSLDEAIVDVVKLRNMGDHDSLLPYSYSKMVLKYTTIKNVVYTVEHVRKIFKSSSKVENGLEICVYPIEKVDLKIPDRQVGTKTVDRWTYQRITETDIKLNLILKLYRDCPLEYFDMVYCVAYEWRMNCADVHLLNELGLDSSLNRNYLRDSVCVRRIC